MGMCVFRERLDCYASLLGKLNIRERLCIAANVMLKEKSGLLAR